METHFEIVTTGQVRNLLDKPRIQFIDIRPIDAYNGWRVHNEERGGHIKTARSVPYKWSTYFDWLDIIRSKNIQPDYPLVIYGYDTDELYKVATLFSTAGYQHICIYNDFVKEWCTDFNLPMSRLKRYRNLVSAPWLHELLSSGNAPELDNKKYVLCHAHYRNPQAYEQGHIPGSIAIDTNSLESMETWNCRSPHELRKRLSRQVLRMIQRLYFMVNTLFPIITILFPEAVPVISGQYVVHLS
jgi:molybdopterin synthase sulfurtransferase